MSDFEEMNKIARSSLMRQPAPSNDFSEMNEIARKSLLSPELSTLDKAMQVPRGYLAAAPGGMVDLISQYYASPMAKARDQEYAEMTGDFSVLENQADKYRMADNPQAEQYLTSQYDKLYGKDLTPTDTAGNIRQGIGSFLSPVIGSNYKKAYTGAKAIGKSGLAAIGKHVLTKEAPIALGASSALHGTGHLAEEGSKARIAEDIAKTALGGVAGAKIGPTAKAIGKGASAVGKGVKYVASPSYRTSVNDKQAKDLASRIFKEGVGEENIPAMLKDFESYEAPLPGYQPLTSETTKNVGLAQMQRAQYGHTPKLGEQQARNDALIKEGLQAIEAAPETMSDVAHTTTPFTAGRELQGQITKNIDKLKAEREAAHAPYQKAIEEHKPGVYASKTYELIDKELQTAKGPLKNSLLKVKGYLEPNIKTNAISAEGINPKYLKTINEQAGTGASAHELRETISQIGDMIGTAERNGATKRAKVLMKVKESLLEDLVNTPVEQANKVYSEKSKPISKINEQFGAESKKDRYKTRYLMRQYKASESIISKSMQNPELAEGFNAQFSQHPESIKVTKGYINNDLHKKVIDKNGYVNLGKLHSWKTSNPYAETIYPDITKKLDNLQKKGLVDKLNTYLKDEKNISYDKLSKFIKENEGMLNESLDENQMKVLRGSELALSGRHASEVRAKAPGSPTASNQELLKAIQQNVPEWILKKAAKGTLTGQAGVWLYNFFRAAKKAKAEELVNAALIDKDIAKLLATHANDTKTLEATANKLKDRSYIPRIIVMNHQRKEDKDNE